MGGVLMGDERRKCQRKRFAKAVNTRINTTAKKINKGI
jgi:hypothetical protein